MGENEQEVNKQSRYVRRKTQLREMSARFTTDSHKAMS